MFRRSRGRFLDPNGDGILGDSVDTNGDGIKDKAANVNSSGRVTSGTGYSTPDDLDENGVKRLLRSWLSGSNRPTADRGQCNL